MMGGFDPAAARDLDDHRIRHWIPLYNVSLADPTAVMPAKAGVRQGAAAALRGGGKAAGRDSI
jgi:hypothetical protein